MAREQGDRDPPDKPSEGEGPGSGPRWVGAAAVAVVVTVAIVAYAASDNPSPPDKEEAELGAACESLDRAASALVNDQEGDLVASLKAAEKAAFQSLDQSGVRFGRPERIALEAASEKLVRPLKPKTVERLRAKLAAADKACEAIADETA